MRNVYTVSQVNSYIKNMFTQDFMLQSILIRGEVSNCKYHSSGHIYFTLKDEKGCIACVMFAGNRAGLSFRLQEGQQVIAGGVVDVYERDGKYQMYAKQILLDGAGILHEQYEKLKIKLEEMGMFAEEYKKPIPPYIQVLGIVTAPTGAAVRDIISIAKRRNPFIQLILYPAIVQGAEAPQSIVQGIRALEQLGVDAIIVGRGGGSMEDLWAFNEEVTAQAIFDCSVPIISAVGHETDTTISDYVADLRAPTPSAAAELAVYDRQLLEADLLSYQETFTRQMMQYLMNKKAALKIFEKRLQLLSPMGQIREKRTYAIHLEDKLLNNMEKVLQHKKYRMQLLVERLRGLSPLEKLSQGYSILADDSGHTITDIHKVQIQDKVWVHLKNGKIKAEVLEKADRKAEQ